jgi:hypothetical protein
MKPTDNLITVSTIVRAVEMEIICTYFSLSTRSPCLTVQQRPTRFQAQADAINQIHYAKTSANPESSVGLMSMGGKGPEVLVTLTADIGKILDGLHRTKIRGGSHLASSIQVAAVSRVSQGPQADSF